MVLGNRPFDKILETLKFSKEHAPHSQYIVSNILKMYLFYILLGEEMVIT
jgi:hypothetical protein